MKKRQTIKEKILAILFIMAFVAYEISQFHSRKTVSKGLSNIGGMMKQVPWSIPYVIVCVVVLYFIGKLSFFEGLQIGKNDPFDRDRKSTKKEVFATLVFGLVLFAMVAGFFIIMS